MYTYMFLAFELFVLYLALLVLALQIFPSNVVINYSQTFHNFSVGIGAILAGIGGLKIFIDYSEQIRKKGREKEFRSIYNPSQEGIRFNLIKSSGNLDWIYIHDLQKNKKIHIGSDSTLRDLGYTRDKIITMSPEDFNRIPQHDDPILTRGDFGT